MRVSVFGIGYVGAVTSACLTDSGHSVIAVDKDPDKVSLLAQGLSPIIEPGLGELIQKGVCENRLSATDDCSRRDGFRYLAGLRRHAQQSRRLAAP